jgi:tetratricopeptide (TPR) repeat protein
MWQNTVDHATLTKVAALLDKAIALNNRDANAYAMLAEARSSLSAGDADGVALRAVSLDPSNAFVHYAAARVLRDERRYDDALQQAQAAARLASDESMRRRAADLTDAIQRAKSGGG